MKKVYQEKDTKTSENRRKSVNEANVEFLNNDVYFQTSARANCETHM